MYVYEQLWSPTHIASAQREDAITIQQAVDMAASATLYIRGGRWCVWTHTHTLFKQIHSGDVPLGSHLKQMDDLCACVFVCISDVYAHNV